MKALTKMARPIIVPVEPKKVEWHDKKIPALRTGRVPSATLKFVPAPLAMYDYEA